MSQPPMPQETRSQVDWQAWLMPMDCFSCHQGENRGSSILMPMLEQILMPMVMYIDDGDVDTEAKIKRYTKLVGCPQG